LRLYVDQIGRDGVEYPTAVGPIDILAIDGDEQFVLFELKRGRSKTISPNLHYSIAVMPNVSLFEYEVKFELKSTQSNAG
jgi:hypothetical protein